LKTQCKRRAEDVELRGIAGLDQVSLLRSNREWRLLPTEDIFRCWR